MENKQYGQPRKAVQPNRKTPDMWKKRTAAWSRWLHTYLSMISFVAVLFFAVTGFTLHHAEWFEGRQAEKSTAGKVPSGWVHLQDTTRIKKLEIVEFFRNNYGISGYVSEFLIDDQQCALSFKGPGYSADVFISREDGTFRLTELRLGLAAVLNDLHRGRDTGKGWGRVVDVSAVFLTLVSVSGLAMLFFLKKKRVAGIVLAVAGALVCYAVFYFCVP